MRNTLILFLLIVGIISFLSCSEDATIAPDTVTISGVVQQSSTGESVADASVIALKHDTAEELGRTVTETDGSFFLKGLPLVTMDIRVEAAGYAPVFFESMDPTTSLQTMNNMTVQMDSVDTCCSGVFTLVARDSANVLIQGPRVIVRKGEQTIADLRFDANGKIIVDGLCAGIYSYRITSDRFKVFEGTFIINENCDPVTQQITLEYDNKCCSGVLTVTAVDSVATPIQGVSVKLWKSGTLLETATTNSNGIAIIDSLCTGEYGVDLIKTGFNSREFGFAINQNCDPYAKTVEMLP